MNFNEIVENQLIDAKSVLEKFLEDSKNVSKINEAADIIVESLKKEGKVISCGNGGSMCDAMHFAEELTGKYKEHREPYAAISISDPSHISCVGNDYGYNMVFSRFVHALGIKDDVLLAISTSGQSENILKAIERAKLKNLKVIALTGKKGIPADTADYVDVEICVSYDEYSDRIQEMHIKIIHILIHLIEIKMNIDE
jgi:D-sedoheptulose 7-phosphate isomerase